MLSEKRNIQGASGDSAENEPLYVQIEEQIQQMIRDEGLGIGDAIPGRNLLSRKLNVNCLTLRKAISHLTQRGVLATYQGRGTFVASNPSLKKILFVDGMDVFETDKNSFYTHFFSAIQREASDHGLELKPVWLSNGRPENSNLYCNAKALRGYDGVIFFACQLSHPLYDYVKNEGINHVFGTYEAAGPKRVTTDYDYGMEISIDYLHHAVGDGIMIVCNSSLFGQAKKIADREGKVARIVKMDARASAAQCEANGYHLIQKLIRSNNMPSGIIFLDDVVARGASRAVLEAGWASSPPAWVVFCGLQEIVPLGFPVAYIALDTERKAKETIRIILDQIEDRHCQPTCYVEKPKLMLPEEINKIVWSMIGQNEYMIHECASL